MVMEFAKLLLFLGKLEGMYDIYIFQKSYQNKYVLFQITTLSYRNYIEIVLEENQSKIGKHVNLRYKY